MSGADGYRVGDDHAARVLSRDELRIAGAALDAMRTRVATLRTTAAGTGLLADAMMGDIELLESKLRRLPRARCVECSEG